MDKLDPVYLYPAFVGGFLLFLFAVLNLMGFRKQPGLGHDRIGRMGFNFIHDFLGAFFPIVAAPTVFAVVGLLGGLREWDGTVVRWAAISSGLAAAFLAHRVPVWLEQLELRDYRRQVSVGQVGVVSRLIPGNGSEHGAVFLRLDRGKIEFRAISRQGEILPGTRVTVHSFPELGLVEVVPETDFNQILAATIPKPARSEEKTP